MLALATSHSLVLLSSCHPTAAKSSVASTTTAASSPAWTMIKELSVAAFDGQAIKRLAYSRRARLIVCIDAVGRIHLVSPDFMVVVATCPLQAVVVVTDVTVLEDEGSDLVQLMLLTKETTTAAGTDNRFLEIRQLNVGGPDFKLVFRLAVSPFSHLITAALSQEVPMLLEGGGGGDKSDPTMDLSAVTKLRLRGIAEGVPEVRLARMLRRRRFAEADAFATAFGLDKETLHQARAAWLLSRLSVWEQHEEEEEKDEETGQHKDETELFQQLTSTLGQINSLEYVMECCCLASLPTLDMTRQLLLFARQRLTASGGRPNSGGVSQRQMLALGASLHRLETFIMMTDGQERTEEDDTARVKVTIWIRFRIMLTRTLILSRPNNFVNKRKFIFFSLKNSN